MFTPADILLALTRVKGISNAKALEIYALAINSHKLDISNADSIVESFRRLELVLDDFIASRQSITDSIDKDNIVISYFDDKYPAMLKSISNPPPVLFVKGNLAALHYTNNVAIVGTRYPTEFGCKVAYSAGKLAAEYNLSVVSGLALGCDTNGHLGCLDSNGCTVAVLAHGLDKVYPKVNEQLAALIVDSGGTLVSEYPVGIGPFRWSYSLRNRIQSGLSAKVLVIETGLKGGTLHTVGYASKQGRLTGCLDHPVQFRHLDKVLGNRRLLESESIIPITDRQSLVDFYMRS